MINDQSRFGGTAARSRLTHPWLQAAVAWPETADDLRKDDEVCGDQGRWRVDRGHRLDEIWHQFVRVEVGVCSSCPSHDFEVSGGDSGEDEEPHLIVDRLPKMDDW